MGAGTARRQFRNGERGFSYVIALLLVAVLAIVALRGLQRVSMNERREKEAQLLEVGQAYRTAIRSYYVNTPGSNKLFPLSLNALLLDDRTNTVRRHLRRLYRDPLTASQDWGLVTIASDEGARIVGVYSLARHEPVKVAGFPAELQSFTGAKTYQNWQFVYQPTQGL